VNAAVENDSTAADGGLEIMAGGVQLGWLTGAGDTMVHDAAMLTVGYAVQNSATIGDGDLLLPPSGLAQAPQTISGLTRADGLAQRPVGVPEPGAWLLLAAGVASLLPLGAAFGAATKSTVNRLVDAGVRAAGGHVRPSLGPANE
jgi:hypothetical protein